MITVEFEHDLGVEVKMKAINLTGRVDSMARDNNGIMYRVVYWNDGTRRSDWVYSWEIESRRS
jgi:hypothetical protein